MKPNETQPVLLNFISPVYLKIIPVWIQRASSPIIDVKYSYNNTYIAKGFRSQYSEVLLPGTSLTGTNAQCINHRELHSTRWNSLVKRKPESQNGPPPGSIRQLLPQNTFTKPVERKKEKKNESGWFYSNGTQIRKSASALNTKA